MATQKFTNFAVSFKMHADMTTIRIQLNKIVSKKVKDNKALLEPSYGKHKRFVLVNPINFSEHLEYRK